MVGHARRSGSHTRWQGNRLHFSRWVGGRLRTLSLFRRARLAMDWDATRAFPTEGREIHDLFRSRRPGQRSGGLDPAIARWIAVDQHTGRPDAPGARAIQELRGEGWALESRHYRAIRRRGWNALDWNQWRRTESLAARHLQGDRLEGRGPAGDHLQHSGRSRRQSVDELESRDLSRESQRAESLRGWRSFNRGGDSLWRRGRHEGQ